MTPKLREGAAAAALAIAIVSAIAWWKLREEEEKNARQRERARERAEGAPEPTQADRNDYVLSVESLMTSAGLPGASAEAQGTDLAIFSSECDREMVNAVFYTFVRRELEARGFTRIVCKMGEVGFAKPLRSGPR